jgi:outer membrane protein
MVTDFGRTSALVNSARATAEAQADAAILTRAQVRLNVRESHYQVLGAEAVLRAARAALDNRALISRQLTTLAESELRSTLDVNFAKVLQSEPELAVVRAESAVAQQRSHLATAMGLAAPVAAPLADVPATADALPPGPDGSAGPEHHPAGRPERYTGSTEGSGGVCTVREAIELSNAECFGSSRRDSFPRPYVA